MDHPQNSIYLFAQLFVLVLFTHLFSFLLLFGFHFVYLKHDLSLNYDYSCQISMHNHV